ncbi:MAG TPA: hypothetical protein DEA96_18775 [Leptospiraceae bacterium]|nr:hypothetical protein [Spirochaetaceae bacterium]HBS07023.1 hypothetical protein [Leptospiraceae bacterium]|tara:strand:+ start:28926 stop:29798 length:873 start_codon:yes stop_codon:yes gene_type:complete
MWLRSISILFFQLLAVNSLFADANVWSEKLATDRILFSEDQESISAATISRSGREIQLRTLQNGFSSLAMEMAEEDELSHWLVAVRQVVREAKPLELPLSTGNEPDTPFPWLASGSGVLFSFSRNRKGEMSTPLGVPALSYGSGNEGSVVSGKEKAGNNSLISKCYHSMRQGYSGPGGVSQPHSTLLIRLSFRTPSYSPHSSNSSQIKDSLRSDSFIQSSYRTLSDILSADRYSFTQPHSIFSIIRATEEARYSTTQGFAMLFCKLARGQSDPDSSPRTDSDNSDGNSHV